MAARRNRGMVSGLVRSMVSGVVSGVVGGDGSTEDNFGSQPVNELVAVGDSITFGVDASSAPEQWLDQLGAHFGITPDNNAVSGTVLQNSTPVLSGNLRDNYTTRLLGAAQADWAVIAYGFNDARYTGAPSTFNKFEYRSDYFQAMTDLIANGYNPEQILIVSPYYITDTGLVTGSAGFTGQTRSEFELFVQAAKEVAEYYGCWYIDMYQYMLANGGASLISGDDIHPNDTGHDVITDGAKSALLLLGNKGIIARDLFDGPLDTNLTSHTPEIGLGWEIQPGYTASAGPRLDGAGGLYIRDNQSVYRLPVLPEDDGYEVEIELYKHSTISTDSIGVAGRMYSSSNTLYWARWNESAGAYQLYKTVSGSSSQLGSNYSASFGVGETHTITLRMDGSTIDMFVDDVSRVSVTDTAIPAVRYAGIRCTASTAQTSSSGIHITNLEARKV